MSSHLAPRCVFGTCQVFAFSCLGHSWSLRTLLDLMAQLGLGPRWMKINGDSYDVMKMKHPESHFLNILAFLIMGMLLILLSLFSGCRLVLALSVSSFYFYHISKYF